MNRYQENATFACTRQQQKQIADRAKQMGIPKSVLLREAVLSYLESRPVRDAKTLREEYLSMRRHGSVQRERV